MSDEIRIKYSNLQEENKKLLKEMSETQQIELINSLLCIYRNISVDSTYGITVQTDKHLLLSEKIDHTGKQFDNVIKGINDFNESIQNFTMTKCISSNKGRLAENMVATHISKHIPHCEIECTSKIAQQSDLHVTLFDENSKPVKILVEIKNWKYPISRKEIMKFYRDMQTTKDIGVDAGLFISLTSGISGVKNLMTQKEHPITCQPYMLLPQVNTYSAISIVYGLLYLQEIVLNNRRIGSKINQDKHEQIILHFEKFRNKMGLLNTAQEHLSIARKNINSSLLYQEKMLTNLQLDLETSCDKLLEIVYKS